LAPFWAPVMFLEPLSCQRLTFLSSRKPDILTELLQGRGFAFLHLASSPLAFYLTWVASRRNGVGWLRLQPRAK
jgi:hypothetical protein